MPGFMAGAMRCLLAAALVAGTTAAPGAQPLPVAQGAATAAAAGPSFRLTDQHGRAVDHTALAAKPSVLHFGFTRCPVVCPTTMFEVGELMRALGPFADQVNFVFVTVDPEHDTPSLLATYLGSFDDRILGLSGPESEIKSLAAGLGATFSRHQSADGSYSYDHSTLAYLMTSGWGKAGALYMGAEASRGRIVARVRALVAAAARASELQTSRDAAAVRQRANGGD